MLHTSPQTNQIFDYLKGIHKPVTVIYPNAKNPIVSNLDALKFEFVNGIDILQNDIKKTVLLQSSPYSKLIGTPVEVNLNMVTERPEQSEFKNTGNIPIAVLMEGKFHSVYENRGIRI